MHAVITRKFYDRKVNRPKDSESLSKEGNSSCIVPSIRNEVYHMLVKDIMTKDVITVKKEASIREIAQTIVDHDVSGLPVMDDDGTVCGIVSEGDLVRKEFAPELPDELCILGAVIYYSGLREYQDAFRKIAAISAEQLMTKKIISVKADDDVSEVAKILYNKHVKRVPVLDEKKHLLGIVSRRDIVKMMLILTASSRQKLRSLAKPAFSSSSFSLPCSSCEIFSASQRDEFSPTLKGKIAK